MELQMINSKCFAEDWIKDKAALIGSRNPVMLEKATVALQLLGYLAESGLSFQFKGGTSLLLRLDPIRRLSIDVDIVTQASFADLTSVLDGITKQAPFLNYQHEPRRDRVLPPKKHFKVFYPSVIEPKNDHILLDVLFEPEEIPGCEPTPIHVPFIEPLREVMVAVPSVNHLLGDKLTAFAPETIGILYHPERKTDIAKQLFDVGVLFDAANDLEKVAESYDYMHQKQLGYRQKTYTGVETLNDTISAAFAYCQVGLRGGVNSDHAQILHNGVRSLQNHLLNQPFAQPEARIAAAKAACLSAWLQRRLSGETFETIRFDLETVSEKLERKHILPPWAPLDRLRGGIPEAFHYWYHAQRILKEEAP
jgi:hypothetical protein